MSAPGAVRRALLGRPVALAYGVVVALYLLRHVRFQPLQLPAYLLIAAYDLVEVAFPAIAPYHPVGFPFFLYGLSVLAAGATRLRRDDDRGGVPRAVGGVAVVVAALSFLFAAAIGGPLVSATDNPTPLAVTAAAGVVLAAGGWWLLSDRSAGWLRRSA